MLITLTSRCARTCLSALLPVALATTSFAQAAGDKQKEAIVRQLRRQESLVRSARATFHVVALPTPADKASRIREACKLTGRDANSYIYTAEDVEKHSFAVRWFRKGVKERLEYSPYRGAESRVSPESAVRIGSFDGNVVRSLEIDAGEPFGAIDTIEGAHWKSDNHMQPCSFIYEWYGTRFSDVIEKSEDAKLSTVTRDGREYTEVTVPPKEGGWLTVVLLFDQDNRMVERKEIGKLSDDPKPRLYSKAEFSGYQRHEGPGKDAIWFPHKAVYHYYGHVGDGNIEEYRTETVDVRSIEFNVDIPDETFALQFPPGTKIHDSTRRSIYSLVVGPGQWLKGKPLPALEDFGVKPAGGLAGGKRIAVCFCDLQQRPSRHAVETLAARAELWRQKGLVVVLIIPGGDAGTASTNWLKEHKATFTVGRLPADEGQARRILTGWGATALPHIVVTDASHTVEAEAVAADALEAMLKDSTGAPQPAPAAARPVFYPLAGLDEAIRQYKKGLDPVEQERLKKMDDFWKQDLERGWKPPWSKLAANLTDREIESLSAAELGRKLFDNGLPARTLMLYKSTNTGTKRLEVLYKGYKELFHRSDCWKGLIASVDYYAAQLAVSGKATDNVNAIAGLMTVPKFYSYPAIRVNITGHEREIIAAHVRALRRISAYLNASAASTGKGQPEAFFGPMAPSALINWALALGQGLSEQQYQAARAALANPKWAKGIPAGEVRAYIDEAAIMLEKFTSVPPTTQPAPSARARQFMLILLDDAGKPIDGAEVSVTASSKPDSPVTGRTDSQGRCTIPLPATDADRWHFEVAKPGYVPLGCWVERTFGESLFVDPKPQRMSQSRTIGGVVQDEAGRPIKNVTVDFGWRDEKGYYQTLTDDTRFKQACTDEKGRWSCNFVPAKPSDVTGYIQIFLRHPDYVSDGPPDSSISLSRSRDSLYPRPPLDALWSQKAVHVIKRGTVLTGKVTDSVGKPVAGAEVMLAILPAAVRAAVETTAADGTFTFQHADPICNACIVTAKGYAMEMAAVDANSGAPLAIRLSPGLPIDVRFVDSRGVPVPQVQVGLVEWRGQLHMPYLYWWTGIGGRFTWPDAPADGAVFHIGKAGYMAQRRVILRPSDRQQVITLSDPLRVAGRVLDAATGKLIEGAKVTLAIGLSSKRRVVWERPAKSAADGTYEARLDDGIGQYSLRAEAKGYMILIQEVVPGDATRLSVDFRMEKAEPIAGTVLGLDAKPVAKAKVKLLIPSAFLNNEVGQTTTGTDGGFSFTAIPDDYVLTVEAKDGFAQVSRADLAKNREVRLVPWGRIDGVVIQGTKPVAKADICGSAVQDHPPQQAYRHIYATADAQGRFVIQRVPPGPYWLGKVIGEGHHVAATNQRITVRAGKTTSVTLGGNGRLVVARLKLPAAAQRVRPFAIARIQSAAFMELRQHMKPLLPEQWDCLQLSEQAVWRNRWLASEQGKKDRELAEEVRKTDRIGDELLDPDGSLKAYDLPAGKYVLCVYVGTAINRELINLGALEHPFEVPPIGADDLDTPLDLGTLKVVAPEPDSAQTAAGPAATAAGPRVIVGGASVHIVLNAGQASPPAQHTQVAVDAAGKGKPTEVPAATRASPGTPRPAEIARLIEQLAGETAAEREAAQQALVKIGSPALGALTSAASDKNHERAARAKVAIAEITMSLRRQSRFAVWVAAMPAGKSAYELEKSALAELKLDDNPILCDMDIIEYDWDSHLIRLTPEASASLYMIRAFNTFFVVTAEGKRCYLGMFSKPESSYIGRIPTVDLSRADPACPDRKLPADSIQIRILIAGAPDSRSDARIRKALEAAGKLKAPAPAKSPPATAATAPAIPAAAAASQAPAVTRPGESDPAKQASPARLGVQVYRLDLPPSEIEKLKKSLAESTDDVPSLDNDLRRQGLLADLGFVAVDLRSGAKLEAPKVFPTRRQVRGQTLMVAARGKLEVSLPSVQLDSNDPPTGQVNVGVSLSDLTEASRSGKALPAESVSPFKVEYKGLIAPGKPAKVFTEPGLDKCVYLVWIRVKAPAAQPAGREVFIPDADTKGKGVVLDLASGEMLPAGEKDQFGHFAKLGKGDLAFDRALICLRGARTMRLEKDEVSPMKPLQSMGDMSAYELPQVPCRLLVLVGKDKVYEIEIRKLVDGGIAIRYGQARPREARKAKQGVARPANESSFWQQNGPATRPAALVPVPAQATQP